MNMMAAINENVVDVTEEKENELDVQATLVARIAELEANLRTMQSERDRYKQILDAELKGKLDLMRKHGAKDGESISQFINRLCQERAQARKDVKKFGANPDKLKKRREVEHAFDGRPMFDETVRLPARISVRLSERRWGIASIVGKAVYGSNQVMYCLETDSDDKVIKFENQWGPDNRITTDLVKARKAEHARLIGVFFRRLIATGAPNEIKVDMEFTVKEGCFGAGRKVYAAKDYSYYQCRGGSILVKESKGSQESFEIPISWLEMNTLDLRVDRRR